MSRTFVCPDCEDRMDESMFYKENNKRGFSKRCKDCFDRYIAFKKDDKVNHCNWCFGYGVFFNDGIPLGVHEIKQKYPAKECPVCHACYSSKKRSVIQNGYNPFYPW